ncbi:adenosylmethionine decarboxylase [Roseomonas hellenica]|uniref:S-adenosylmethionine decarboxylase proenzyme n=1 Tax=Plastoroseomonas hellenica TaxID=2687306 RepID=A0ABS5EUN3_9PROT|nr:adenosylmethionine decarboxylase [Plastoroseomonas hellenica]MBR0664002.1 adenosylmethionine decarboxylase [Plastoroseomonas hellenica]
MFRSGDGREKIEPKIVRTNGSHILCDFDKCSPEILRSRDTVEDLLLRAARLAEATIVASHFHAFSPEGISGIVLIAESHLSIHTWPSARYAAVDLYTCGELDSWPALAALAQALGSKEPRYAEIHRRSLYEPVAENVRRRPGIDLQKIALPSDLHK